MVGALVSGSGWILGQRQCVVFLGMTLNSHSARPLSNQVCRWVPTNLMLEVTLHLTSIRSLWTTWPDVFIQSLNATETFISSSTMDHLA